MDLNAMVIQSSNPNQKISLIASETLNELSEAFRESHFQKNRKLKEGFTLNPYDLFWEYIIYFGDSTIVFKELKNTIYYWAYLEGDNDPNCYKNSSFKGGKSFSDKRRFCELINSLVLKMELEKSKK
jgi:hypothetical protein